MRLLLPLSVVSAEVTADVCVERIVTALKKDVLPKIEALFDAGFERTDVTVGVGVAYNDAHNDRIAVLALDSADRWVGKAGSTTTRCSLVEIAERLLRAHEDTGKRIYVEV